MCIIHCLPPPTQMSKCVAHYFNGSLLQIYCHIQFNLQIPLISQFSLTFFSTPTPVLETPETARSSNHTTEPLKTSLTADNHPTDEGQPTADPGGDTSHRQGNLLDSRWESFLEIMVIHKISAFFYFCKFKSCCMFERLFYLLDTCY